MTAGETQEGVTAWIFCQGKPFDGLVTEDGHFFG
jgi:hypothetical protein